MVHLSFTKLNKKNIPAVVIRGLVHSSQLTPSENYCLVYIYEEQKGCVKLAGYRSETFSIRNGTHRGWWHLQHLSQFTWMKY